MPVGVRSRCAAGTVVSTVPLAGTVWIEPTTGSQSQMGPKSQRFSSMLSPGGRCVACTLMVWPSTRPVDGESDRAGICRNVRATEATVAPVESNRTNAQADAVQSTGPPAVVMVAAALGVRCARPDAGTTTDVAEPQLDVAREVPRGARTGRAAGWSRPSR